MMRSLSRAAMLLAVALFLGVCVASASTSEVAAYGPISCIETPFGRRMTLGFEQEYALVHAGAAGSLVGVQSVVHDSGNFTQAGNSSILASFATAASIETTHIDLDGDGKDEWAVAGIKTGDAHTVVVTTFQRDPNQPGTVLQGPVWEWNNASNILDVKIATADLVGRKYDSRQELVVAIRDATQTVRVLVLDGSAESPTIQWGSNASIVNWVMPAVDGAISSLRMATGDVLLAGNDQILLMGLSADLSKRVYYLLRFDFAGIPYLAPTRYFENRVSPTAVAAFDLHIADLGSSPAAEMVVHDQIRDVDGLPISIKQSVKYFTTLRDGNNAITDVTFHSTAENALQSNRAYLAVAVGELDRKAGAEIALVRQHDVGSGNDSNLWIELYKVNFTTDPATVVPYLSPTTHTAIRVDEQMFAGTIKYLDATIGDPDTDGIGELVVAAKDQISQGTATPVVKLRGFAIAPPEDPGNFPDPDTFAQTRTYDFPAAVSDNLALHVDRLDFDGDSLLADIGASCKRIHEPTLRTVVHLPPYWKLLQGSNVNFLATIGRTKSNQTTDTQSYGTFTSHDISGYVGVSIGGDVAGAGAKLSAKVTAGYNVETKRGELFGTQNTLVVGQSQSQDHGEGLVVAEDNTFECYSYDVHTLGVTDGNIRSCELIDGASSVSGSDLVTWDTVTAANSGAGSPQWIPLAPDWASVALFRVPTANFAASAGSLVNATDGSFASGVQSPPMVQPYVEIDLGGVNQLTNVRIFHPPGSAHAGDLDGFSLYASALPFSGAAPPSGPNVAVFAPDPASGNGFDHWSIWLRDPNTLAARPVRYLRVQAAALTTATLSIGEIQAFADTHIEPPGYPEAVCDPTRDDGVFTALMYDANIDDYRKVDVRGQLLWSGAPLDNRCGTDFADTSPSQLDGVQHFAIWNEAAISSSAFDSWDLADTSGTTVGDNTQISHSSRVGAELDVEAGAFVKGTIGGAYEFTSGVTEESASTMYWGTGLEYAGAVGGLSPASLPRLPNTSVCGYRPQPFAYTTHDFSNIGYEHQFTVVDYVVRDLVNYWGRGSAYSPVPTNCYVVPPDRVYSGTFE